MRFTEVTDIDSLIICTFKMLHFNSRKKLYGLMLINVKIKQRSKWPKESCWALFAVAQLGGHSAVH